MLEKNPDRGAAVPRQQIQQRQGHLGLLPLSYVANIRVNLRRHRDLAAVTSIHYS